MKLSVLGLVGVAVLLSLAVWMPSAAPSWAESTNPPTITPVTIGPMNPLISRYPTVTVAAPNTPTDLWMQADIKVASGFSLSAFILAMDTLSPTCGTIVLLPGTHNLGDTPVTTLYDGARRYAAMRDCVDVTGYGSLTTVTLDDPSRYPYDVLVFHDSEQWVRGSWGVQNISISRMKVDLQRGYGSEYNNRHAFNLATSRGVHYEDIWVLGGEENFQTSENVEWGRFIPSDNTYRGIRCEYSSAPCIEFQRNTRNALVEDFYCYNCGVDEGVAIHEQAYSGGINERPQNITWRRMLLEDTSGLGRYAMTTGVRGMLVEDVQMIGMGAWRLDSTRVSGVRIENVTFRRVSSDGPLYWVNGDIVGVRVER